MTRKDYEKLAAALGRAMGKERKAGGPHGARISPDAAFLDAERRQPAQVLA